MWKFPSFLKIVTRCKYKRSRYLHWHFLLLWDQIWTVPLTIMPHHKNMILLTSKLVTHAYPRYLFHHIFSAVPSSANTATLNPLILREYSWLSTLMEPIPHPPVLPGSSQPSLRTSMLIDEAGRKRKSIMLSFLSSRQISYVVLFTSTLT